MRPYKGPSDSDNNDNKLYIAIVSYDEYNNERRSELVILHILDLVSVPEAWDDDKFYPHHIIGSRISLR
jgi:hypothetical protein